MDTNDKVEKTGKLQYYFHNVKMSTIHIKTPHNTSKKTTQREATKYGRVMEMFIVDTLPPTQYQN